MNNIRPTLTILILLLVVSLSFSLDQAKFDTLISNIQEKKYTQVEKFLNDNEDSLIDNPEYYVILINYILSKGDQSSIFVAQGDPKEGDLAIKDPATNEVIGFLGPRGGYDEELIFDGISRTQKALPYFKSRLDIHFGIVICAEKIKRWDIVGIQLEDMLKISKEINNKWTWGTINSMEGDPEEFMTQNILSKTYSLFRQETKEADAALEKVSRALIKYYPEKIYGYANLGSLYMALKEYKQAEYYLKKALEIDPNDVIVLGNLKKLKELYNK
jgi:tetratricopeptide (TPR) repeat protein